MEEKMAYQAWLDKLKVGDRVSVKTVDVKKTRYENGFCVLHIIDEKERKLIIITDSRCIREWTFDAHTGSKPWPSSEKHGVFVKRFIIPSGLESDKFYKAAEVLVGTMFREIKDSRYGEESIMAVAETLRRMVPNLDPKHAEYSDDD
jgi:hypothetical protein